MIRAAAAVVTASLFLSSAAIAQGAVDVPAGAYVLDPGHASVTFRVKHMGLSNYTARFAKLDATLTFDPKKPDASSLDVSIDPASVRTDYPFPDKEDFDAKLAKDAKWFNAGAHPKITFKSKSIAPGAGNAAKVTGDLTFLGVTKPVTLDVILNGGMKEHPFTKKPVIGFSATGAIKRSEFGMTQYVPVIGDDVSLLIEAEFTGS